MVELQALEEGVLSTPGFKATGVSCGLKNGGTKDISLLLSEHPCTVAMAFTKNKIQGAHISLDKERVNNPCHAVLINSGNANCLTGQEGIEHAHQMVTLTEELLELPQGSCLLISTGIIGQVLNMSRVKYGIERLINVIPNESNLRNFGAGISTSQTRQKHLAYRFKIDQEDITIGVTAKGESMVKPWLETMQGTLATIITTNINISQTLLQEALSLCINKSFNRMSIDNDISPNDTVLLLTNKQSNIQEITDKNDPRFTIFTQALETTLIDTVKLLLKQGLGTTKVLQLSVSGCVSEEEAEKLIRLIAESYLVKTMLFGQKIIWHKIINILANNDVNFDLNKTTIRFNNHVLFENGIPDNANIAISIQDMSSIECSLHIELQHGTASSSLWTCDLTHDYVKFNSVLSETN